MYSSAILPVGSVNLKTGANKMFGQIFDCWEDGTNMLVQFEKSLKIVHTSGSTGDEVGTRKTYHHDQTMSKYGEGVTLAVAPHSLEGLQQLAALSGKKSLPMYTYK